MAVGRTAGADEGSGRGLETARAGETQAESSRGTAGRGGAVPGGTARETKVREGA